MNREEVRGMPPPRRATARSAQVTGAAGQEESQPGFAKL